MARAIFFELGDDEIHFDFGTYSLMMYYAYRADAQNGKLLFDSTLSEYRYRINYGRSVADLNSEDLTAHFIPDDLQQVIDFIDNVLLPNLNSEQQPLLEKYGGLDDFVNSFYPNSDYIRFISPDQGEYYSDAPLLISDFLIVFKEFLQNALTLNKAYEAYVL